MSRGTVEHPLGFGAIRMRAESSWLPIAAIQGNTIIDSVGIISAMGDRWKRVSSQREKESGSLSGYRLGEDCDVMAQVWGAFLDSALKGSEIIEEEKRGRVMTNSYLREHPDCIARGSWSFAREVLRLGDEQTKEIITGARRAFQALIDEEEASPEDVQKAKGLIRTVFNACLCGDILRDYRVIPISVAPPKP